MQQGDSDPVHSVDKNLCLHWQLNSYGRSEFLGIDSGFIMAPLALHPGFQYIVPQNLM